MTAQRWKILKEVFAEAIERSPEERERFAQEKCEGDAELLSDLLRMLAEHEADSGLLSSPVLRPHPEAAPRFAPGDVLAGRFRIERWIASGGMGEVYEAEDLELHERVALKSVRPSAAAEPRSVALFRNEVLLARRVTHPNVCRVYDLAVQEAGGRRTLLLSMELLAGGTLADRLRDSGPMAPREALALIEQVAAGLQAAHGCGIVHRDLKPGNILLVESESGATPRAVITDFGLAYSAARAASEDPGSGAGTPEYAAPEQMRGAGGTIAADIYSFAALISEAIGAKRNPAGEGTRIELPPGAPPSWRPVLERCLSLDPARRYRSAEDVAASLRRPFARRLTRRKAAGMGLAAIGAAAAALAVGRRWLKAPQPEWILITALDNRTGEPLLDESVPFLLERDLANSTNLYIAPRARVEDTLRLMRRDPQLRIDEAVARDVCLRDGGIQLIGSSRAERLGRGYLFSYSVREAVSGRVAGGATEQVQRLEDVPLAVERLAAATRGIAGLHGGTAALRLAHVTTPSLRACQLYSQTYREGQDIDWSLAEQLSRAAIAEDPQFASAYLWLMYAILNQRKPEAEWRPFLEKAVSLSGLATDRERQFILATKLEKNGDPEGAVAAYRRMLASYPDDFWSRNNLAFDLRRLGRETEANQETYRLAELRPTDWRLAYSAMSYASVSNDTAAALRWRDRLVKLDPVRTRWNGAGTGWTPEIIAEIAHWAGTFGQQESWLARRLEQVRKEADRTRANPPWGALDARAAIAWYEALGRLGDAAAMIEEPATPNRRGEALILAYLRDDSAGMPAIAAGGRDLAPPALFLAIRREWTDGQLEAFVRAAEGSWWLSLPLGRSRLAALRGDPDAARMLLEEAIRGKPLYRGTSGLLLAGMAIARAYELGGRTADALRALEAADAAPLALDRQREGSTAAIWQRMRYDYARLLRVAGRDREAAAMEAALAKTLRLADPGHPVATRLGGSGRRRFSVY